MLLREVADEAPAKPGAVCGHFRCRLTLGCSTFVPKAHTPFQWYGVSSGERWMPALRCAVLCCAVLCCTVLWPGVQCSGIGSANQRR